MLIYVATTFFVCLIGCTWAQYYGSQPPTYSQQNQQQQNSEAWRRWYYQQRQQEQQAGYNSARARQSSSVTSPAANSQYSRYQRQPQQASGSSPQYAQPQYQQYYQQQYQQRQPSTGYNQQQGYAQSQPSYGGYQQPQANYRPQPPVTPPPTTPAENGAAFGGGSSLGVQGSGLNSLVSLLTSPAAKSYPGTSRHVGQGGYRGVSGSNAGIGNSPGLATAVQLLSRYNQVRPSPYNMRNSFPNSVTNLQNRARLQYALSQRNLPQRYTTLSLAKTAVNHTVVPPTTTPKAPPVVTEFEYEGPTTTTAKPKRAAYVSLNTFSMGSASIPRQQAVPQTSKVNNPQPYLSPSMTGAPPGYVRIDAFRADLMTAIQLLSNEIAGMTNGVRVIPTTASPVNSIAQHSEAVMSKKLAALPGNLSFLLGKFASKLPAKVSVNQAPGNSHKSGNQFTQTIPQRQQPQSEWTGVFDLTPEQPQQVSRGTWPQSQVSQVSFPQHQSPLPQQQLTTTSPPSFQMNHQQILDHSVSPPFQPQPQPPPHDLTAQTPVPSWHRPPPEQLPRPQPASNNQHHNYMNPPEQRTQINQQRERYMSQPHPLDIPPQPSWQSAPSNNQPPVDPQWSQQQPPPQDLSPPSRGPSWQEPVPQQPIASPTFAPNNQQQRHQNAVPYEQPQYQPPFDLNQGPKPQPQNEPLLLDLQPNQPSWQHQQPGTQNYQQEPLPQPFHQQPPPQQFPQEPPPQYQQPPPSQQYQQEPPLQPYQPPPPPTQNQQHQPMDLQWPPQQIPHQLPPPQDFAQPPGSSWELQTSAPFDTYQQHQPNSQSQHYYQEPQPLQPQRPPPLDISNYGTHNSQFRPIPRLETAPQFTPAQNAYDPTPPVDLGGINSVTYTSPV